MGELGWIGAGIGCALLAVSCMSAEERKAEKRAEYEADKAERCAEHPAALDIKVASATNGTPIPICRVVPDFPYACWFEAKDEETVVMFFNITPEGSVERVRGLKSNMNCLQRASARALFAWRFEPSTEGFEDAKVFFDFDK